MSIFVQNLRRLRLAKGYTQERLAEELGVSAQSVSRWECGNTLPDVMLLPKLARLYGITVDDLYREEVNAYPNYAQRLVSVYEATRRTEDFLAAEQEFARLLAGEHTADDLRSLGVLYHYMTKRCAARAKEYLEEAIQKADRTNWVYSSAAQQKIALMCDLGRGSEEAARYDQELEIDTADSMRWLLCVAAHHYAGENQRAYELACEAIKKFPDNAALHVHAGNICRELKRYEEAFVYWHKVQELDSSYCDATYSMGFCYEELGQYGEAFKIWSQLHKELLNRGFTQECQLPAERVKFCEERMQ